MVVAYIRGSGDRRGEERRGERGTARCHVIDANVTQKERSAEPGKAVNKYRKGKRGVLNYEGLRFTHKRCVSGARKGRAIPFHRIKIVTD